MLVMYALQNKQCAVLLIYSTSKRPPVGVVFAGGCPLLCKCLSLSATRMLSMQTQLTPHG